MGSLITVIRAFLAQNFAGVSPYLLLFTMGSMSFQYVITYIDNKEVENNARIEKLHTEMRQKIRQETINNEKNNIVRYQSALSLVDLVRQQCLGDGEQIKAGLRDAQQNIVNIYRCGGFKNISRERN